MPDLDDGARALDTLRRELLKTEKVENDVAWAVLSKAQRIARGRPTPQARLVAGGMTVRRSMVIGHASTMVFPSGSNQPVKLGFLSFGSEFGSNRHKQFGPRRQSGYWLHPAADQNPAADKEHEDHTDEAIDAAIRSAGQ